MLQVSSGRVSVEMTLFFLFLCTHFDLCSECRAVATGTAPKALVNTVDNERFCSPTTAKGWERLTLNNLDGHILLK